MKIKKTILVTLLSLPLLVGCGEENLEGTEGLTAALEYGRNHSVEIYGDVYYIFGDTDSQDETLAFTLSNTFTDKVLINTITYKFDLGINNSYESTSSTTLFAKDDGNTYYRSIDLQNTVTDTAVTDSSTNLPVNFSENYSSPLKTLKFSDLVALDDQYLVKPQVATSFAQAVTLSTLSIKKVTLTHDKGKFDYLEITTNSSSSIVSGISASYRYELRFKWDVKASEPVVTPYEHYAAHDKLETALFNLDRSIKNKNFLTTSNVSQTSGSATYYTYSTDAAIYSDAKDSYGRTYGAKRSGSYWYEFVVTKAGEDDQSIKTYDEDAISEEAIFPRYRYAAIELFKPSEDGKSFTAYPKFAQYFVYLLAPAFEASSYAENVSSVTINLNDKYEFDSLVISYLDYYNSVSGTVTVTYSNFGETELPITL